MIVVVKGTNYKSIFIGIFSLLIVSAAGGWYYLDLQNKVVHKQEHDKKIAVVDKKEERAKALEKIIFKEAEISVELLNQARVQAISVFDDKLLITCDNETDIEPLMIRYGAMALVKNTSQNIKIAIDLAYIIEDKYEES